MQLVEALRYKPVGRGFDSRWCHCKFSLTYSFWPHYGPGVDSASNRNEYQEFFLGGKGGRCVRLTTLPPSCDIVMKSETLTSWNPQGLSRPVMVLLSLLQTVRQQYQYKRMLTFCYMRAKLNMLLTVELCIW